MNAFQNYEVQSEDVIEKVFLVCSAIEILIQDMRSKFSIRNLLSGARRVEAVERSFKRIQKLRCG